MSKNVSLNKQFLHLLLTTSWEQGAALLDTVTTPQALLISEIALNLLQLPLQKKAAHLVRKKRKVLQKLADKKVGKLAKRKIIRKHYKFLLDLLLSVKLQLEQL